MPLKSTTYKPHRVLACAREATDIRTYFTFIDIFNNIGGSTDPKYNSGTSYGVTTVNLKSGEVGQVEDTLRATSAAASTSSLTRIALCGGETATEKLIYCQMYSTHQDK